MPKSNASSTIRYQVLSPFIVPLDTYTVFQLINSAFTSSSVYEDTNIRLEEYPIDLEGYPRAPIDTEKFFFQIGSGWYESTPQHRSPDNVQVNGNVYTGQNYDIQTQLLPELK